MSHFLIILYDKGFKQNLFNCNSNWLKIVESRYIDKANYMSWPVDKPVEL